LTSSSFRDFTGNSFISYWYRGQEAPRLTTPGVPDGIFSNSYAFQFHAEGGVEPYTWSLFSGALPPGLALDETSGGISEGSWPRGPFPSPCA
jgi:hypothetical protein